MAIIMTIIKTIRTIRQKGANKMKFITVTELKLKATQVVAEIERSREEVVVTKNGKPVVLIKLVSDSDFKLREKPKVKEVKKYVKQKRNL